MITETSLSQIKEQSDKIINILESISNLPLGKPIEQQGFQQAQKSLKNILFRLQFALLQAEEEENWELVDSLADAIEQCEDALNAVRAAMLKQIFITPDHKQIIDDLEKIKGDINNAIQTEKLLNVFISLTRQVIRFAGV